MALSERFLCKHRGAQQAHMDDCFPVVMALIWTMGFAARAAGSVHADRHTRPGYRLQRLSILARAI